MDFWSYKYPDPKNPWISWIRSCAKRGLCMTILLTWLIGQNVGQNLDYREAYDIAAARAVAELKVLAEYCLPLIRVGGLFVAAKGHDPHEEIKDAKSAVQKLGASMIELCNVESMGPHGQRTAVIYIKERATPKKYPRLPGTPSKMPL
uniref:Methyltransferase gidB, putative n=1 Tax=Arundo donax TaxID=35708 RepID=A0A0A9D3Z9_ARUDO